MVLVPTDRSPTHPGEMLREELLKPLKITQEELADLIGVSLQTVNQLVNRHSDMTLDVAVRLERLLGMSSDFWMNLQARWDSYQERQIPWKRIEGLARPLRKPSRDPDVIPFPSPRGGQQRVRDDAEPPVAHRGGRASGSAARRSRVGRPTRARTRRGRRPPQKKR